MGRMNLTTTKWEYKLLRFMFQTASTFESSLNQLGDQGWEVCGVINDNVAILRKAADPEKDSNR